MDHPVFDHEGPWSESAYLELPRNDRVEVVEGTLLIGPGTSAERAAAVDAVREAVFAALPEGLVVRGPVSLRLGPDCVLVPDLIVTADRGEDGSESDEDPADQVLDADAALMVIEVVGGEHGVVDRSFKPQLYAGRRIPYLLLIDYHGPFAIADMIINGRYHEYARAAGDEPLRIEEPFRLELDLRAAAGAAASAAAGAATSAATGAETTAATDVEPDKHAVS